MRKLGAKVKADPRPLRTVIRQDYPLYLFLVPAIASTILFSYLPMFMNYVAFLDYKTYNGWMGLASPFVGFDNFVNVLSNPELWVVIGRTIYYSALLTIVNFPACIVFALLLNEVRSIAYKRTVQTLSYLPHFVSWVTVASLFYLFMSVDSVGLINNIREFFGFERISIMKDPGNFPIVLVLSSLYKGIGWGSIIYLAAISGVDQQLYEAAKIDGASRFKQVWHITLPCILPTISLLLVMNLGSLFSSNFDHVYNFQNPLIQAHTNTIATLTYEVTLVRNLYSRGAAIGLFQGVVNAIFLLGSDKVAKKLSGYGLF